jgi:hypothetical protein
MLIKTKSLGPLTSQDIQTGLSSTGQGQATKPPVTVLSYSTFASLTPGSPYATGHAGLGASEPFRVNFGGGGALGSAVIQFAPTTVVSGGTLNISLIAQANQVYVFDVSFSPVVLPGGASTGTFIVGAYAVGTAAPPLNQTDVVPVPATGGNPTYHMGFVVTATSNEQIVVFMSSPDSYWNINKCDIYH